MKKSLISLLLLTIIFLVLLVNIRTTAARWLVGQGEGPYVERVCQDGIVFNYFHDWYGVSIGWDEDPLGNDWISRKVESCQNGTCEELNVISADVGSGGADLTLGPNHVADFWILRWSDNVPIDSIVTVTLDGTEFESQYDFSGIVDECTLPEIAPSFYSFCSSPPSSGNVHSLNVPDINIIDLELNLASSNVFSSSFSANLTSPNGTSIKILDNNGLNAPLPSSFYCSENAAYMAPDDSVAPIISDAEYDPYDLFFRQPLVPLAKFNGISLAGEWQLNFEDFDNNPFTVDLDCLCLYMVGTPIHKTYLPVATGGMQSTTANQPPNIPANPSPTGILAIEDKRQISLQWSGGDPNGNSVTSDVYLELNDSTPDILVCGNFTETQCDLNLGPPGKYYWQVISTDSHGAKTTGPVWEFSKSIDNPGFEERESGWTAYTSSNVNYIIYNEGYSPITPYNGNWAARLGQYDIETSYIEQQVHVVPELPILVYWHFIVSDDLCDADFAEVKVNGDSITSYSLCYDESTNGWEQKVIDLSAFSGQTIDLQIRVSTDQSIISSLYVDDFSFESSAPAQNSELVTIAPVQQPPIMQKHP